MTRSRRARRTGRADRRRARRRPCRRRPRRRARAAGDAEIRQHRDVAVGSSMHSTCGFVPPGDSPPARHAPSDGHQNAATPPRCVGSSPIVSAVVPSTRSAVARLPSRPPTRPPSTNVRPRRPRWPRGARARSPAGRPGSTRRRSSAKTSLATPPGSTPPAYTIRDPSKAAAPAARGSGSGGSSTHVVAPSSRRRTAGGRVVERATRHSRRGAAADSPSHTSVE